METQKNNEDDEIDLLDLFSVLLNRKILIIRITGLAMILVLAASVISLLLPPEMSFLPNEYTPKALMLINDSSSSGGMLSSMLSSSGLSSLASLAGISTSGGSTYSALAVYLAGTNDFLDSVVDKFDLVTRYKVKKSPRANSRKALAEELIAEYDEDSSVFSISFTDIDPFFAQSVVNFSVEYMQDRFKEMGLDKNVLSKANLEVNIKNCYDEILSLENESHNLVRNLAAGRDMPGGASIMLEAKRLELELTAQQEVYKQLKIQYELLKVTMASETPVFQVLEYAEVPDKKSGPSRGVLCVIVIFSAFFLSVFLVFLLNTIDNIKKDPEAMAKLKGISK